MRSTARRSSTAPQNGLGAPIGSHLTPNDPGYVDLTGLYPHDPAKAKALLQEAGVKTPLQLTLTLPPPPYARQGGEIIAAELAEVGIQAKIENVEWAQWLSNVYTNHNFDLTIISHVEPLDIGIYANPNYYFGYDSKDFQAIIARWNAAPDLAAYKQALGDAQKKLADDSVNGFLYQLPNVDRRRREAARACGRTRRSSPTISRRWRGSDAAVETARTERARRWSRAIRTARVFARRGDARR